MTSKTNPMNTVQKLASMNEFEQSKQVAGIMRELNAERERLDTLEQYLNDYMSTGRVGSEIQAGLMRSRQDFLSTLAKAIDNQKDLVRHLQVRVNKEVEVWRKSKARLGAVDQFIGRRIEAEKRELARREQAELDETANRLYS